MNEKDSNIHRSDAGTLLIISVFYAKIGLIFNPSPKRQKKKSNSIVKKLFNTCFKFGKFVGTLDNHTFPVNNECARQLADII